ncbi:MAG: glycosyltransferase family 87 protein [Candidatus Sulfotelmatobacter sp.]
MKMRLYKAALAVLVLLMFGGLVDRGIVPAVTHRKSDASSSNDFAGPWIGAWMWRHGQNPYDVALTSVVGREFLKYDRPVVLIYPATACMLLAPFTFLSWNTANFLWSVLCVIGVLAVALVLLKLGSLKSEDIRSWLLVAIIFSLTPLRAGVLVENPAIVSIALCLSAVYLASLEKDIAAGIVLAMATALKPNLCIWILLFYLLRRRWRLSLSFVISGVVITSLTLARVPLSPSRLLANYMQNIQETLSSGGSNAFIAGTHLGLLDLQVVLYPMVGRPASMLAYLIFAIGLGMWFWAVQRNPSCPETLALSSLLALGFLPIYHRAYDVGILTLSLCWALARAGDVSRLLRRTTLILMLLFLIPERLFGAFAIAYLPATVRSTPWWYMIVLPHSVWILLLLNIALLCALVQLRHGDEGSRSDYNREPIPAALSLRVAGL